MSELENEVPAGAPEKMCPFVSTALLMPTMQNKSALNFAKVMVPEVQTVGVPCVTEGCKMWDVGQKECLLVLGCQAILTGRIQVKTH